MPAYDSKLDFLISALDLHLGFGTPPAEAWDKALEDYSEVYHVDDGRTELARAADRALHHFELHELEKEDPSV